MPSDPPGKREAASAFHAGLPADLEAHHPLRKQFLLREARTRMLQGDLAVEDFWGEVYPPQIAVALSREVHERHTNRTRPIPLEHLPSRVVTWAAARGPRYVEELLREHPPECPSTIDHVRSLAA